MRCPSTEEKEGEEPAGEGKAESLERGEVEDRTFPFRGGVTLIIGLDDYSVRYAIYKRLDSAAREARQRAFRAAGGRRRGRRVFVRRPAGGLVSPGRPKEEWLKGRTSNRKTCGPPPAPAAAQDGSGKKAAERTLRPAAPGLMPERTPDMSGETENRLLPEPGEIRMRLYGQGLGDCFLLAFPRKGEPDNENPCYLVIDCGVAMSTPEKGVRIRKVVENIDDATGGHIDVLAITHQHFDHISGFQDAWQEWKKITVDAVYLPWTESTARPESTRAPEPSARSSRRRRKRRWRKRRPRTRGAPGFRAQADFLGVSLGVGGSGTVKRPANMDATMEFARDLCPADKIRYFEPGDVFRLPGTDSHGYVLGPPLPDRGREREEVHRAPGGRRGRCIPTDRSA